MIGIITDVLVSIAIVASLGLLAFVLFVAAGVAASFYKSIFG